MQSARNARQACARRLFAAWHFLACYATRFRPGWPSGARLLPARPPPAPPRLAGRRCVVRCVLEQCASSVRSASHSLTPWHLCSWQCYTLPCRLAHGRAPPAGPPAAHATPSRWPTACGVVRARSVCVELALDAAVAHPGIFLAGSRARAFCRPARRPRRHPSLADECAAGRGYVAPSLGSTPPWPATSSCWLALRARWTRRLARPRSISSTRSRLRPTERVPICTHFAV